MKSTRRVFMMTAAAVGATLSAAARAQAMVEEKDAQALALGYVSLATHADSKKFPKYAAGQTCASCALYQGKPGDASGGCAMFPGKHVSAKGWCSAYSKKA